MSSNLIIQMISIPCGIFTILSLLRMIMQVSKVSFYNNYVQFVKSFTDIYCAPLRKILPNTSPIDLASLIMAILIQAAGLYLIYNLASDIVPRLSNIFLWSLLAIIGLILRIYFFSLLLSVIFSWVTPQGFRPLAQLSQQLTRPLLQPLYRFVPPMGGLDFSPMAVFLLIYLLQMFWYAIAGEARLPTGIIFGI